METGQRYPVSTEEVVIGRTSGDLLFPNDSKLSNQHCRIVMTPQGLAIHDMNSANGTTVDGQRLTPETVFTFKAGHTLEIGAQTFKLQEAGHARKLRRRNKKSAPPPSGFMQALPWILGILTIFFGTRFANQVAEMREKRASLQAKTPAPTQVESPMDIVDKEVRAVFDRYRQIGSDHQSGKLPEKQLARLLRQELLPTLGRVQTRLGAVRGQTEFERRKLDNTRQLITALIGQVTAMADVAEKKDPKSNARLQKFSEQLQVLNEQAQTFKRKPAQSN
ncbi:MAG: FHA domain-containing protein [Bdellovibrionales bacterium]|nr:FHA domain-containing protein [Bdellovibrionales bacterium]